MNKSELIDKLNPQNGFRYFSAFIWGLVIGSIGFSLDSIVFGIISMALAIGLFAIVYFISAKLHPDTKLKDELSCPLCNKGWTQRDGLLVLADRQCPHCDREIELK